MGWVGPGWLQWDGETTGLEKGHEGGERAGSWIVTRFCLRGRE